VRTRNTPLATAEPDDGGVLAGRRKSLQMLQARIDARIEQQFPSEELRELALRTPSETSLYHVLKDAVRAGETDQIKRGAPGDSSFADEPTRIVDRWFSRAEARELRDAMVREAATPAELADALRTLVVSSLPNLEPGLYADLLLRSVTAVDYRQIALKFFGQDGGDPTWPA
jgi:hypothetical protein